MKIESISKVVISESDIISALEYVLQINNLKPKNQISINIVSRCEGYGMNEHYTYVIGDTIIECEKLMKTSKANNKRECPNCGSFYILGTMCEKCGYMDKSTEKKYE